MIEFLKERSDRMFDVLVDQPKKRFYLLMMMFSLCIVGSIVFDGMFAFAISKADSFSQLMDIVTQHPNSYFGYFFYSLVTSPALYSADVIYLIFQIGFMLVGSLNCFDWLTVIGMTGLAISHKHKMSRLTLLVQICYFVVRIMAIIVMVLYLYPGMMSNMATLLLSRIHLVSIVMFVMQIVLLIFMVGYLINIIKLFYLPLFEEEAEV